MLDKTKQIWQQRAKSEFQTPTIPPRLSPEGIDIQPLYSAEDLRLRNYVESYPGLAPFTRGPRATMYTKSPWTIRQYAGFSSAEETNAFYHQCIAAGQKGLSVAFDLPTHRGYDSDHPRAMGDVGMAGVAIDSVEDMKLLFRDIALDQMSVSMTMNGAVLPILASFILAAEEQGYSRKTLSGTIQNDILKEYMVRNTYIYPPEASMRIVADIIAYTSQEMPRFNSISISGYHMQEAGADSALELAYTLADGIEYVRAALSRGLAVDEFAPRLSFFFGIGMNFFMEIAKLRAARTLWYELMQQEFAPKQEKSAMLRTHCQTSGYSLTLQDPFNNVIRTTIEALAATLGGTQSLHTNSFDEAIALPSDFAARLARNTQLILQKETDLTATVDPFGGSYFMESLTHDLSLKAKEHIAEITQYGGMTKAILRGIPKRRIEEAAAKRQARLEKGEDSIIGVNLYPPPPGESDCKVSVRSIDNQDVCARQIAALQQLRKKRDGKKVEASLERLRNAACDPKANLLPLTIDAMKERASLGEVSAALESVFSRYQAPVGAINAVYGKAMQHTQAYEEICTRTRTFAAKNGRRPRILVAKLGQDGHDRGAKVVATALADMGFVVDLAPLFQTPDEIAKRAVENDVHMVGISSLAAGHMTLLPQLLAALKKEGAAHIFVSVGGIIPPHDISSLAKAGVAAFFDPGKTITACAAEILALLENRGL
jgi:methylmalonyl-CoA mutase